MPCKHNIHVPQRRPNEGKLLKQGLAYNGYIVWILICIKSAHYKKVVVRVATDYIQGVPFIGSTSIYS